MRKINNGKRDRVIADLRQRIGTRAVARKHNVSQSFVSQLARTLPEDVRYDIQRRAGRPSRISATTRRFLVRNITNGEVDNAVQAQKLLADELGVRVSPDRVRQILRQDGLSAQKKVKKPKLTIRHRRLRMEFVNKYRHWTIDDWKRVLWTDETKINRYGSDGTRWVWRNTRAGLQDRIIDETLKHGGGSLIMWGCMHWEGVGYISRIEGGMDARLYVDILDECVPLTLDWYGIDRENLIFQHDNDPKHTANIAREYLKAQNFEI